MRRLLFLLACVVLSYSLAWSADMLTEGVDQERTGWQKDEKTLTTANVKNLKLLWKVKVDNKPHEMHSLLAPLVADHVSTANGAKQLAIVAGSDDNIFAVDVKNGELLWKKHFESTYTPPVGGRGAGTLCPGGQTAVPALTPPTAQ